jgi:glucan phosphorylase|tara:strand:- start:4041 stop:4328 length:288 start_codon:yes stop_codon:yes gene_type:complete
MSAKKILNDHSYKEISSLFKTMLMLVEDMKKDHDFHYQKLYDEVPKKYHPVIKTADHFTPDKLSWIRKRILDHGNESVRNMEKEIENYQVSFKFK